MATLRDCLSAIERHIGFPKSRSITVSRRLQERGALPLGAPGIAPELDAHDVVSLIIALAADTALHEAPDAVERYRALTPGGADLTDAPASIDTAGRELDIMADIAIHGNADLLRRDRIEVVANWPEVAITDATSGQIKRFVAPGALATNWQANGHRKSTTINGSAFVDCIQYLFERSH
ncbi:hypothetical protein GCM10010869_00990 [Mesorhizobium tianshanense]|uniref:Uncharacterized protein n=1 Tax=Mesorhizobium tianshanense TaxID=39844 RepID=A0A562NPD9_9HYPH|nr:hypothetical protein [Mesorhizobium tianshanense]TWI34067.1 hypothetical protein IQ26_03825 [Mesorhizobium tianshanense]GLS34511.1 hypothetical protein GCM10010869_00990 [Mesorhizobium tianshanense]